MQQKTSSGHPYFFIVEFSDTEECHCISGCEYTTLDSRNNSSLILVFSWDLLTLNKKKKEEHHQPYPLSYLVKHVNRIMYRIGKVTCLGENGSNSKISVIESLLCLNQEIKLLNSIPRFTASQRTVTLASCLQPLNNKSKTRNTHL